jgi:redox-sensitive bicupin YhaK (pirin superfamily)
MTLRSPPAVSPPRSSPRATGSRCEHRSRRRSSITSTRFLLLHHMGTVDLHPGDAKGAPDHPHREDYQSGRMGAIAATSG